METLSGGENPNRRMITGVYLPTQCWLCFGPECILSLKEGICTKRIQNKGF